MSLYRPSNVVTTAHAERAICYRHGWISRNGWS